MASKVIWSEDALDLNQAISYIAKDNPDAALRVGEKLLEHTRLLANFPMMGRAYLTEENEMRLCLSGTYRIYYSYNAQKDLVLIHHVWHGSRQDPRFKKG
jgi:toxin ParE1/3/4